jgi:hypothetical protein
LATFEWFGSLPVANLANTYLISLLIFFLLFSSSSSQNEGRAWVSMDLEEVGGLDAP